MSASDHADAGFRRDLILASAYFHGVAPSDRIRASCARVLRYALIAANLWNQQMDEHASALFSGDEEAIAEFPVVQLWYSTLIELTQHEPESERLLAGGGNLVTPAGAFFTACWLTAAGKVIAKRILAEHPNLHARLTAPRN